MFRTRSVVVLIALAGAVLGASAASAASRICTSADTLSFGQRDVGTRTPATASVANCGDESFQFTDVHPDPATSAEYRIVSSCATGLTLAPQEQCAITVSFEPTAPGQVSGALWLHNTTSTPDQLITFYGRGVDSQAGTAGLAFSPAIVDFGAEAIGTETTAIVVTLRNTGFAPLVPSALVLNGSDPYDFRGGAPAASAGCGIGRPIAPGATCLLDFYFRPQAIGERRATLVVDAPQLATLAFLTLAGAGAASATINVIEFHNQRDDQYFLTADAREVALLDSGGLGPDWSRTGASFRAWPLDATDSQALPVCRFFGTPGFGPESHFYTAYENECEAVRDDPHWIEEGVTFRARIPGAGSCADDDVTVMRLWRPGSNVTQSRHRYVVDPTAARAMQADGWVLEGAVFCAPR